MSFPCAPKQPGLCVWWDLHTEPSVRMGRACESCARGWLGEQGKHRAGRCGRVWWRRSFARTSLSRSSMITNRMYGSMCGSRASEPSSRSRLSACTIRARMVGAGVSERGARWLVVELCARELPALPLGTAQRLLPVRLAIWSCRPAPSAARLDALPTNRLGGNAGHRAGI